MSLPLVVNGVTYNYPQVDDTDWGPDATDWASAVTTGMLQKAGGLFQLLSEVDFGTAFGVKSLYIKSRTANPADAGQIRLARADVINWRNQANGANLSLGVSASDVLQFNGADIQNSISVSDTSTIDFDLTADVLSADIVAGSITNSLINAAAAIAYSKLNLAGSIVNADINASAAIAYSKLALSNSIVNADINASAAIAYSKLDLTGSIVNADVSASAAIAFSKLAALTSAHILVGSAGNVATNVAMSGDITISNAGVTAIGANKVVNSMLAQMAQSTIKGRAASSGTGDPVDLTATQATAILNNFVGDSGSGGTKGLVPAPASGDAAAGKFLKADGSWVAPTGSGDVVGPGSATDSGFAKFDGTTGKLLKNSAATISNGDVASNAAIAFSKLATLTSAHILVGSAGNVATDVAVTGDISLTNAGVTAYSGTVPLNKGGTGQTTKAPAFDALSPMSAGGDLIYGGASGTGTRLPNGSAIQLLSSAGSTNAPVWAWPGIFAKRSVTTTDAPTNVDNFLYLSSGSFTVTLFDAIANPGKIIILEHQGISLTQVYTLATTSGQTIGGVASGNYVLQTLGETLTIISDGANWRILDHYTTTDWTSVANTITATSAYVFTVTAANATIGAVYSNNGFTYTVSVTISGTTTLTCSGTGTPTASGTLTKVSGTGDATITFSSRTITGVPAKASVTVQDAFWWRRVGSNMEFRLYYAHTSATGGVAGSGDYLWSVPANITIDTTRVAANNTVGASTAGLMTIGAGLGVNLGTSGSSALGLVFDATHFRLYSSNLGINSSTIYQFTVNPLSWSMMGSVPILGWQP